jgi:HK97 gp10 family phage protein
MSSQLVLTEIKYVPGSAQKAVNTTECRDFMLEVAKAALTEAQATAPVLTGAYLDSLSAQLDDQEDGSPAASLTAGTDHWQFVEFGTIHQEPQHVLGNAVAAVLPSQNYTELP